VALGLVLIAGACSSSSNKASTATTTTGSTTSSSSAPVGGTSASSGGAASAPSGGSKTINLAIVPDLTGAFAPLSGPALYTTEAAIQQANAAGGVNGYTFKYKVYDAQSTPAGGLNVARQILADHPFAVIGANSQGFNAGLPILNAAKMPVVGDGDSVNWSNYPYIFSISGNILTQNTTSVFDELVAQGKTRIGVVGGTINPVAVTIKEQQIPFSGGQNCFGRTGIDGTNTATLVAIAHELIAAHCQAVVNPTLYPGAEALQSALNQLGGNVTEVEYGDIGPAVIQQYGSSIDNMIYTNFFASPYATADPGVQQYLAAMAKYEPGRQTQCTCIKGYADGLWFLAGFQRMTANGTAPSQAGLVAAMNSTTGFDANGLVPAVQEPQFHTQSVLCQSYSVIKNGQWQTLIPGPNPYQCGKRFVVGAK
jgi:ABC-type branched-subunit amino acid transport system substrate-binding protein